MQNILTLDDFIKWYSIYDVLEIEKKDDQYKAIWHLWNSLVKLNKCSCNDVLLKYFFDLIITNSLISYQLSWKWENWWIEFSDFFSSNHNLNYDYYCDIWIDFLMSCKNNRRLLNWKISRLKKIYNFISNISLCNYKKYIENPVLLNYDLSKFMKQAIDAKTIVFAVKMFWYGVRNTCNKEFIFPIDIKIPVDSRIEKIYYFSNPGISSSKKSEIINYFDNLSIKYSIPPLHLDSLIWIKYWYLFNQIK